jgi:hypothetical protein
MANVAGISSPLLHEEPPSAVVAQFSLSDPAGAPHAGGRHQESGTTATISRRAGAPRAPRSGRGSGRYLVRFQANPVLCSLAAPLSSGASIYARGACRGRTWPSWTLAAWAPDGGYGASGGGVGLILESADLPRRPRRRIASRVHGPAWQGVDAASPAEQEILPVGCRGKRQMPLATLQAASCGWENSFGLIVEALAWRRGGGGSWLSG